MGNSRAKVGLLFEDLDDRKLEGLVVAKCTHTPVSPWIMRSAVERCLDQGPDLVVLLLSELDTHRTPGLVASATFGDVSTVATLARGMGLSEAWRRREGLERIALASLLHSYRYRSVLGHAWLDDLRHFPANSRALTPDAPERFPAARPRYNEPSEKLPDLPDIEEIHARIERAVGTARPHTLRFVHNIHLGNDARIQELLLGGGGDRMARGGSRGAARGGSLEPRLVSAL